MKKRKKTQPPTHTLENHNFPQQAGGINGYDKTKSLIMRLELIDMIRLREYAVRS